METNEIAQTEQKTNGQMVNGAQETTEETNAEIVVTKSAAELAQRLKEVSAEAKQYRQKLAQEKKASEEAKQKSLIEQGQYKELADIYKVKSEAAEAQAMRLREAFAMKTVADAVALEAAKLGCVDTDALIQLMPLDQIPIKDNFEVDRTHVKTIMEEFKKGKSYLFQKQSPRIPDGTPGKQPAYAGKSLDQMTSQEIEALLKEKYKKG